MPYYPIMLKLAERNSLCHKTITFLFWFLKNIFLIHFKKYENQLSIWCKPLRIKRSVSMFSIQPKRLYQVLMFSFKKKKNVIRFRHYKLLFRYASTLSTSSSVSTTSNFFPFSSFWQPNYSYNKKFYSLLIPLS